MLIYAVDSRDAAKRAKAIDLLARLPAPETIIPWQVACELAAVLYRMKHTGALQGDPSPVIEQLRSCFPIILPQVATLARSQRLIGELGLSTWDAMLIAACADAGVARLFTEDLQSGQSIAGVEIINPFS